MLKWLTVLFACGFVFVISGCLSQPAAQRKCVVECGPSCKCAPDKACAADDCPAKKAPAPKAQDKPARVREDHRNPNIDYDRSSIPSEPEEEFERELRDEVRRGDAEAGRKAARVGRQCQCGCACCRRDCPAKDAAACHAPPGAAPDRASLEKPACGNGACCCGVGKPRGACDCKDCDCWMP